MSSRVSSSTFETGTGDDRLQRLTRAIEDRAATLGLPRGLELSPRVASGGLGSTQVVWLEASHRGVPLLEPAVRVVVSGDTVIAVVSTAVGRLPADGFSILVTQHGAVRRVSRSGMPGSLGADRARLAIVPGRVPRAVWIVDPPASLDLATNPVFAVDANDGTVFPVAERVRSAFARSFFRNPALDPQAGNFPLTEIDPGSPILSGPTFAAVTCTPDIVDCRLAPAATADARGDFLYPAPDVSIPADNLQPADPFAEVSLYYHADKFVAWLRGLGFDQLQCTRDGRKATLVANFNVRGQTGFDNAFFTGDCDSTLVFGQGTAVDFAYDGDVVYHEIGHGVVEAQQGGGFLGWPHARSEALLQDAGALNEAFADFVSSAFARDPVVGEYIAEFWAAVPGPGVRDNDNPYTCPDDLVGEVHLDSEPFAGALWDAFGVFDEAIVPVVLDTMAAVPRDATLEEGAAVLEAAARARLGPSSADIVHDILDRRGLFDCPRLVRYDRLRTGMFVQFPQDYQPFPPPPVQLTVQVPADADTIDLSFTTRVDDPEGGGFVRPSLLVRRGAPIEFRYDESMLPTLVTWIADELFAGVSERARIENVRDTTVHLGFVNEGDAVMRVDDVVVELSDQGAGTTGDPPPPPPPPPDPTTTGADTETDGDTDTVGEDGNKSGCGCVTRRGDPPGPWALLLTCAAGLRRGRPCRRRRRRARS